MKYDFVIDELDMENSFGKILSQVAPDSVVLECGCATGYMTKYMKEKLNCDVYIVEIEREAFEIAKKYAKDGICADLTKDDWCEKFAGKQFDCIMMCDVLEHVGDPKALLQKVVPFLKRDGQLLVSLPNVAHNDILMRMFEGHWDYQERGLLDSTHIRFWGIENIDQLFAESGLGITVFDATQLPTGGTEQYWDKECRVAPEFLAALRKRWGGEFYQFILSAQHMEYIEENKIETRWVIPKKTVKSDLPLIWEASDMLEKQEAERQKTAELVKILMADNEMLNEKMRETRIYHEKLLQNVQETTAMLDQRTEERDLWMAKVKQMEEEKETLLERFSAIAEERNRLSQELNDANNYIQAIKDSRAFRLVGMYYKVRDKVLPVGSQRRRTLGRIVRSAQYFLHPEKKQSQPNQPVRLKSQIELLHDMGKYERMDVITTPHCMYISRLVKRALERVNIKCEIQVGEPEHYLDIPYLIIAPQFVKNFPPVYFVFQVEQTISSRWFTAEYFRSLQNSCVILDYALQNVEFFHRPENEDIRSRVFYVPLDYYPHYLPEAAPEEKEYDVLFYGSIAGERRGKLLEAVGKKYNLKIVSELYGEELYREIRKAKIVLNVHYYEGALIETTRLFEVLSLNSSVIVSEDSFDKNESGRLEEFVDFVPVDDIDKLLERIGYWLSHDEERKEKIRENQKALEKRANAFDFFFYRFLLSHDRITFDQFYEQAGHYFEIKSNRLCLSLPESTERRRSFDADNKYDFCCIPGLRHEKGWVGAGMSYKFIFKKAQEAKLKNIMICEDDVIFPEDFAERLQQIVAYLDSTKNWSVFSGVMADVGNVKVLGIEKRDHVEYVQIDHMISMVFNIYDERVFALLSEWDESKRNVEINTIDRYLEKKKLNVYTQLPFLVGHKEELKSTIWGFSNSQYADMIANSEKKLKALVEKYKDQKSDE